MLERFSRSFNAKLTALFLLLMLGLGAAVAVLCVRSAVRYMDEADQKINRTLALDLAPRFEPYLRDSVDHAAVEKVIENITGVNRRIEIYLLNGQGKVKALLGEPDREIPQRTVDLEPIRRFAEGAPLPIMGDDPLQKGQKQPFSVAPTEAMGQTNCYLYILLGSEQFATAAGMIEDSYILRTTLQGLGLILLFAGLMGVGFFRHLTGRLRERTAVIEDFEQGRFDQRIEVSSDDEIGQLGAAFNRMADTITRYLGELERADRMRRELVANVSHDLRGPIALIRGYLETLQMKGDALDPEKREEYFTVALKGTKRLAERLDELFELSKLDTQQVEPQIEPFSITELVQDLVMQFRPRAEQEQVTLDADLPERLSIVYADIALVERALSNLVENALRYTPAGGTVCLALEDEGDAVRVRVADDGPGIPEEELPHIFERFYRVEKSRNREGGGTGLGLAIASKILDLHGSALQVKSALEEGTTFAFLLPTREGAAPLGRGSAPATSLGGG